MAEATESSRAPERKPRGRRGLGRGLGALIPTAEDKGLADSSRPLDVLFPNRTGSEDGGPKPRAERGGSARSLLVPRGADAGGPKDPSSSGVDVSRETIATGTRSLSKKLPETKPPSVSSVRPTQVRRSPVTGSGARSDESSERSDQVVASTGDSELRAVPGVVFGQIDVDWIIPNLKQPRQVFGQDELQELADSVATVGVLQPVVLRRITEKTLLEEGQSGRLQEALLEQPEARYELIMGERRWRASQIAGMKTIPAIIRSTDEDDLLRDALIENMHRVQLNPLEEAAAYAQLMEDFSCTQEELSKRIARSRPQIANTLRLLKLPPEVQRQVAAGVLSAGHARALLSLSTTIEMEALAARIIAEGMSVRSTEEQIKFGKTGTAKRKSRIPKQVSPEAQRVADAVANLLETSVSVAPGAKRGKLVIEFADQQDLERIAGTLGLL